MNKQEILTQALAARDEEVLGYQINIDNYRLAIEHIDGMSSEDQIELNAFRQQLVDLLKSELLEQKKAKVIRSVIADQLSKP